MIVPDLGSRGVTMLAAGMLVAGWVPIAWPDPPPAPDSAAGHAALTNDPAVLWTFDSGG
jgi:hypothetical protein